MNNLDDTSNKPHRRSIRLQGYDYSQNGAYFITACAYNRTCLFGTIFNDKVTLNNLGMIVQDEWIMSAKIRPEIELDEFIVMPNHFHGILTISNQKGRTPTAEQFRKPISGSVPTIIRSFKSAVTKRINEIRKSPGGSVWQSNYYEHVIRNDESLNTIREYIINNPMNWQQDEMYIETGTPYPTHIP